MVHYSRCTPATSTWAYSTMSIYFSGISRIDTLAIDSEQLYGSMEVQAAHQKMYVILLE